MRPLLPLCLLALVTPVLASAQYACPAAALPEAARAAIATRHQLHQQAVNEDDPKVPPAIASQLLQLKDSLAQAANAAFACAGASATPEELEKTLTDSLHPNQSQASETVLVTNGKKDLGAYGSDLAVQVFPLFNSPRYYEVDFRYGVECGDDNLLLVFAADPGSSTTAAWHPVLRWGTPSYTNVSDAFGDFILMTPLSGFPGQRNWRFVVAHGQPGCGAANSPSHFDLDLLEPTSDPAQPRVVWHLEHEYRRAEAPRLSTTEDTLTFELNAPEKATKTAKGATSSHPELYRFRVGKDNQVQPLTASDAATTTPTAAAQPVSTSSPQ